MHCLSVLLVPIKAAGGLTARMKILVIMLLLSSGLKTLASKHAVDGPSRGLHEAQPRLRAHRKGASGPPLKLAIPFSCAAGTQKRGVRPDQKAAATQQSSCPSRLPHSHSTKRNDERPFASTFGRHESTPATRRRPRRIFTSVAGRQSSDTGVGVAAFSGRAHFPESVFVQQGA